MEFSYFEQTPQQRRALFDPSEVIAYKASVFERSAQPAQFFVLNPLKTNDNIKSENISVYRNILVEIDGLSLSAQERLIEERMQMPFTSKVFSGSKSFHYIISLENPILDRKLYDEMVRCIYAAIKKMDPTCKNPNRLTRTAGIVRSDTGLLQKLMQLNARVSDEALHEWLFIKNAITTNQALMPRPPVAPVVLQPGQNREELLSKRTLDLLTQGIYTTPSRHEALMKAAVNLRYAGFAESEIQERLELAADLIGVSGRGDTNGIIRWVMQYIEPTIE